MSRYDHRVDMQFPSATMHQHARWAEPRVTPDHWNTMNKSWWVLAVPVLLVGLWIGGL